MSERARLGTTPDRTEPHIKGLYKVTGKHIVHGAQPGSNVQLDLPTPQIEALVAGGHISPVEQAPEPAPVIIKASDTASATDSGN